MKLKATIRRHGFEVKVIHVGNRNYQVFVGDQPIEIHENLSQAVSGASRIAILGPEELQTRLYFARRTPHRGGTGDKKEFDIQLESN
jgi:hypothetical protein